MSSTLLDLLANPPALNVPREHAAVQNIQATTAATQAQAERERALTEQAQAVTQEQQTKNRILQQQLRDAEIQRSIFADAGNAAAAPPVQGQPAPAVPNYWDNPQAFASEMSKRGASAQGTIGAMRGLVELKQNLLKLTPDQVAAENALHGQVAASLQGYLQNPNDQAYAQFYTDAVQKEPELKRELPQPGQGVAPDQNALAHVIGKVHLLGTLLANAKTKQETETSAATAAKAQADASLASAQAPGAAAKSQREQLVTDAMKQAQSDPTKGAALIDAAIPPTLDKQANSSYKAAWQAAMQSGNPEAAAHIVAAAAGHASQISMASNPAVREGKVAEALAVKSAVLPLEVQGEVNKQLALARISPDAFASVQDRASRQAAITNYEKDSKEYADKLGSAQQLQDFVKAAQSGNKAAPGLIPITAVRGLVNRVNRQELESVSGSAGSILDRIEGKINSLKEGQPIPPDALKDLASIGKTMASAARRAYEYKVQVTNKTYGSKAEPIDLKEFGKTAETALTPQIKSLLSDPKVAPGIHTLSDGSKWMKAQDGTITPE